MCVAIGGLRKNLRRAEQVEGMKSNRYGFGILVLRDKKVVAHQRSLREEDIMKVWDEAKDDDYIVTHSRIPSAGGHNANLEDCHLWEREGCYFAHNGTMTNIIDMMKNDDRRTDSLYCFEEIFLPLWKSQGRNFNPLVERVMTAVTHGSRVVIVTPDGEVHYIGKWIEDHGCKMSNSSYRVSYYGSCWSGGSVAPTTGKIGSGSDPRQTRTSSSPSTTTTAGSAVDAGGREISPSSGWTDFDYAFDGNILRSFATDPEIGRLLLTQLVNFSVEDLATSEAAEEAALALGYDPKSENWPTALKKAEAMCGTVLEKAGPGCDTGSGDFAASGVNEYLDDEIFSERDVDGIIENFAIALEYDCAPSSFDTDAKLEKGIRSGFDRLKFETLMHSRVLNVGVDWREAKLRKVFTAWRMLKNRKGRPAMVERKIEDVLANGRSGDCAKSYVRNLQAFYDAIRGKRG